MIIHKAAQGHCRTDDGRDGRHPADQRFGHAVALVLVLLIVLIIRLRLLGHRLEDALSGPMSCNWGLIEGDAQHLWVKLNYRYPVTMERADCQPAVQAAFEAAGWALDGQVHKEKLYYPAETPLVSALLEVYRDATGDNAPPKCIGGGTYAKMLPNVVAFGPLFAGDPVTEHQPDECIDLERLVQNAQIIANAIVKLANLPLE